MNLVTLKFHKGWLDFESRSIEPSPLAEPLKKPFWYPITKYLIHSKFWNYLRWDFFQLPSSEQSSVEQALETTTRVSLRKTRNCRWEGGVPGPTLVLRGNCKYTLICLPHYNVSAVIFSLVLNQTQRLTDVCGVGWLASNSGCFSSEKEPCALGHVWIL